MERKEDGQDVKSHKRRTAGVRFIFCLRDEPKLRSGAGGFLRTLICEDFASFLHRLLVYWWTVTRKMLYLRR